MKAPSFCPNHLCRYHFKAPTDVRWFKGKGFYWSQVRNRLMHRYFCFGCQKSFSEMAFHIDYYAKKQLSYHELLKKLKSGSSIRDMARDFRVTTETIQNKISRLARQAMGLHGRLTAGLELKEELAADGFESYCVSQYYPNNIHLLAGRDSQFLYHANYVTIRRKGRMTEEQKKKRRKLERVYRAPVRGIESSFGEMAERMRELFKGRIVLYTDEKKEYVPQYALC